VADGDADGLGSVALIREARDAALDVAPFETELAARLRDGDEPGGEADVNVNGGEENEEDEEGEESPVALVTAGPHSLGDALERVAEYLEPDADVYVCDLCPDSVETISASLESLASRAGAVRWFDHHQWDEEVAAFVRETGVDLVVGDSDEECTTDVTRRSLAYDFPERFTELAEVTRDHDLWLNEDPRSKDLADYAYWSSSEEYVAVVGAYGADLPDSVVEYVEYRRVEKEALIDRAVDRAEFTQVGEWTVGVTYGRCSQNEVADALREQGADASVVVKPAGSASLRGSDGFERCHEVAALVNGGGHPKAAGCKPDIYDDMLDYAHHWTTEGATTKRVILAAFERVAAEVEPGDEDQNEDENEGIDTER
jgi:oligoribonuclease NrnB/cAMP/cGMP phosphodiesterase (DHH superfamily)